VVKPPSTHAVGNQGEDVARSWLESRGYRYITRNWRCQAGELDLVMRQGEVIVFVEVKARHGSSAGRASESVSRTQSRRILNAAEWYMQSHPDTEDMVWRCDILAITWFPNDSPSVAHFENAIVVG
jgi:putative endonuclease